MTTDADDAAGADVPAGGVVVKVVAGVDEALELQETAARTATSTKIPASNR